MNRQKILDTMHGDTFAVEDSENEIVAETAAFVHGEPPQDADGPPKADSEVEILHEKVTKQIIKEGHGQKPSKYSTCFCKYLIDVFTFSFGYTLVFFGSSFM